MKLDLNTIVKRFKALSPGALIGIMVGACLVVGLAGWFLLIRPQGAKVKVLKAQATEVQAKIDAYHQQVAAVKAAPKIEVADVYRLAKAMPDRTDMPDLLLELSQLARDTGISFDSISPQAIAPIGSYTVLPISVTFQGNFYNLADFLYRLRSLVSVHAGTLDATGRLFSVDTLTFNESTLKFPQIQATLVIDAFVYGSGVAPVPAPAHYDHDHHDLDRDGPERRVGDRSSLMAKKQLDPLKAKQQKQKKILAVLGVVFLGVAAFMGPKLWKQLHPPPLPPRVIPANGGNPVAGAPTLAAPTLRGAQEAGPRPRPTRRAHSSWRQRPFRTASSRPLAALRARIPSRSSSATRRALPSSPSSSGGTSSGGGGTASPGGLTSVPSNAPAPGSAVISVNGTLYTVATKTNFPQPSATDPSVVPLFHLVSVTPHTATISIAGGSYATGAATVTLKENKPVTLMNTADGTRYTLVLKPAGTAVSTGTATTGSSSTGSGSGVRVDPDVDDGHAPAGDSLGRALSFRSTDRTSTRRAPTGASGSSGRE